MEFKFFTNELDEISKIIKESFEIEVNKSNFVLQDNQKILLLKDNNSVVGMTMITVKNDPFKNTKTFYLDYICIKKDFRHKSLGRKMFEEVLRIAKDQNIDKIELTSRKDRINARNIYFDYGMIIKDTDLFVKEL